jgi:uncharacterized protein YozE (UPF0346 family)
MQSKIEKYILCCEKQDFFEAHEVFEDLWFPKRFEQAPEVQLLKGFINAAVSFELFKRGRKEQSKRVWATYLKYRPLLLQVPLHKKEFFALSRYIENLNKTQSR